MAGSPEPDSLVDARFRVLRPADLTDAQRGLYAAIVSSTRAQEPRPFPIVDEDGGLRGPFNAMLYAPALGHMLQEMGTILRYKGSLPPRIREIAIIVVAAHEKSGYEWELHTHLGRLLGLSEDDLLILGQANTGALTDPAEQSLAEAVREILGTGTLSDSTFRRTRGILGDTGLFELAVLVSYYRLLALVLRLFGPDGSGQAPS